MGSDRLFILRRVTGTRYIDHDLVVYPNGVEPNRFDRDRIIGKVDIRVRMNDGRSLTIDQLREFYKGEIEGILAGWRVVP